VRLKGIPEGVISYLYKNAKTIINKGSYVIAKSEATNQSHKN
jgi:hypothetical protein